MWGFEEIAKDTAMSTADSRPLTPRTLNPHRRNHTSPRDSEPATNKPAKSLEPYILKGIFGGTVSNRPIIPTIHDGHGFKVWKSQAAVGRPQDKEALNCFRSLKTYVVCDLHPRIPASRASESTLRICKMI